MTRQGGRMTRFGLLATALAISIFVGGCANTERRDPPSEQPPVGTGGAGATVKSDSEFVHKVAQMNAAQVELSRMALQKASSPEIKVFAQRLIDEHGAAADRLKSAASEASI